MPRIELTASPHSRVHPVQVNSLRINLPVGEPVEVPERVLEVLDRAIGVTYRRLDAAAPAEPASPDSEDRVLDLLDQPVADLAAALSDLSVAELDRLLTAEHNGKTRKTAVQAIEDEIADRNNAEE